jgi:hypothetical protein
MNFGYLTLALCGGLAIATPALAEDCAGLTRHFNLCDAGTDWASGEWEQFGDGATLHLGPIALDSVEDWAGRQLGEASTPEAALDALIADKTDDEINVNLLRDVIETPHLHIARVIQTITFAGNPPIIRASMIAEGTDERVLIMLSAPATVPLDEIDRRSREVAALLRPTPVEGN